LSVVVATRDRPEKLGRTLQALRGQRWPSLEIVVVDDGSVPPLAPFPPALLMRTQGIGRSAARNLGARAASGEVLVFIDDDILVGSGFLESHARANAEWPDALITGAIRLPEQAHASPFGRFRQQLEDHELPLEPGVTSSANFCAAGNLSVSRTRFLGLDGFDPELESAEDQDLALRHSARGGRNVYIPEATAIHSDDALDIRRYCRRVEWGARSLAPFLLRHPDLPANRERVAVNGPLDLRRDAPRILARKLAKTVLGVPPVLDALFRMCEALERSAPTSRTLPSLYRLLLGIHLQKGQRAGLQQYSGAQPSKPRR
jgi:GT2 family glycosyltransferase